MAKTSANRSVRVKYSRAEHKNELTAAVLAFAVGLTVCAALFMLFAALLTVLPLPLSAAGLLACTSVVIGAVVSGYLLARRIGRRLLLCGAGSGLFYAVCVFLASVITHSEAAWQGHTLLLPAALLMGGILGGALTAVRRNR